MQDPQHCRPETARFVFDWQEERRIDVNEALEVLYWRKKFGVDEATLREAVAIAGASAEAVRDLLNCSEGT